MNSFLKRVVVGFLFFLRVLCFFALPCFLCVGRDGQQRRGKGEKEAYMGVWGREAVLSVWDSFWLQQFPKKEEEELPKKLF